MAKLEGGDAPNTNSSGLFSSRMPSMINQKTSRRRTKMLIFICCGDPVVVAFFGKCVFITRTLMIPPTTTRAAKNGPRNEDLMSSKDGSLSHQVSNCVMNNEQSVRQSMQVQHHARSPG